jgi:ABC-2 type transport system permease protein
MGSMFVMFTVFGGMVALVGERKQWTLQRLAVAPVSRGHLLGGKVLGRFTLGFIQYLVVFAVGLLAGVHFGGDILALVLIMVSFTLATTALSFAVGSRVKTEMQAGSLTQLLVLVLAALGGAWWPLEIVPPFMRAIGHLSPVAWAMDGYQSLIFENGDLSTVLPSIAVLLGVAVVCFGFGIWHFKYE